MSLLITQIGGGAGAFEITATSSAITLAGSSVTLAYGRVILASTSAIALAASSAGLSVGYTISATSGAITLAGSTATLAASRVIDATSSAISLAASTATLGVGYVLEAQSSVIALAGSEVDLTYTPAVVQFDDFDTHDGKPRKAPEEIWHDRMMEQKRELREIISRRFRGEEPESIAPQPLPIVSKPLPKVLLDALAKGNEPIAPVFEPLPSLQDVVSKYREIEKALQREEEDEIAMLMLMGVL